MRDLTALFKALGDPTRRRILQLLQQKPMTPSEILTKIEISQPTLSHHIDGLKRAGLVDAERAGQFIRYSLNMSVLEMAIEYIMQLKDKRQKP